MLVWSHVLRCVRQGKDCAGQDQKQTAQTKIQGRGDGHQAEGLPVVAAQDGQNGEGLLVVWHGGASEEGVYILVAKHRRGRGRTDERDFEHTGDLQKVTVMVLQSNGCGVRE